MTCVGGLAIRKTKRRPIAAAALACLAAMCKGAVLAKSSRIPIHAAASLPSLAVRWLPEIIPGPPAAAPLNGGRQRKYDANCKKTHSGVSIAQALDFVQVARGHPLVENNGLGGTRTRHERFSKKWLYTLPRVENRYHHIPIQRTPTREVYCGDSGARSWADPDLRRKPGAGFSYTPTSRCQRSART